MSGCSVTSVEGKVNALLKPLRRYGMGNLNHKGVLTMKPTKRGKRWEIAYRIPGYLRIFHESFATEAEANVRCAEIALAKELGNLEPPQQDTKKRRRKLPTLNEFLIEYVNNYGVKRWGDSQYSVCVRQFRLYVNPHPIGSRLITHISTKDIDQFYTDLMKMPAALRKGERDRGKTVGPSVIEKLLDYSQ